jgi:hypothetical protein
MPVSSTLWDKIENRIDTKPDKPKYWMLFILVAVAVPAFYVSLSEKSVNQPTSEKIEENLSYSTEYLNTKNQNAKTVAQNSLISNETNFKNITISNNDKSATNLLQREYTNTVNRGIIDTPIEYTDNSLFSADDDIIYDEPIESVLLKFGYIDKLPDLQSMSIDKLSSESDNGDERPFIQRLFSAGTQCPKFSRKLRGLFVWSNYTSAYANQSLSSRVNNEFNDYIVRRNDSERASYSYSTSLGFGYIHVSGWYMKTGLTYDQINTRFHQIEENVIGTEEIIRTSKDENGEVTGTFTEVVPIIGYNEIKHTNKLTQIEIPLLFGYELPIHPGFSLGIEAGPNFNLSSTSSGRVLDVEGNPIFFGDNTNVNLYQDKFGVGYIAGAHFIKNLSDKLSLDLGFTYKSYGNIQDDSNPIIQGFSKYGLSSGIKYRFL